MVGRTIGKYRVVEQIGRGGMGTVYKAIDETLDRQVAIKVLNGDVLEPESVERFRREAMTLAKMNHPRIGAIHELTRDGHDLLMVMEFLEGESCEKLIERSGAIPISQAVRICAQVLDALQYAHSAGVVHRDLKPANIMISPTGDIKVMDFGIARVQGSEHLTTHGFMVGTPAYMSPEQVRGEEVDPRMDLYAVAVVFYRLLTNHLPFSGETAIAMIHAQLTNEAAPARQYRPDLPEWVVAVLDHGLAKNSAERFQSAAEFRAALENGLTGKMPAVRTLTKDVEVTVGRMETPPVPMPAPSQVPPPPRTAVQAAAPAPVLSAGGTPTSTYLPEAAGSPAPQQPPPAPARPQAKPQETVTLRAPHLATAGLAIVGLVVAAGVLAFIVLRRPVGDTPSAASTTTEPAPIPPGAEATPASTPAAPDTPPATPAPATTPAPAAPRAAPAPAAPAPSTASTLQTDGAGATARGADSTAARADAGRRSGPPKEPPLPAAADAPAQEFGEMRVVVADGSKGKEVEATLSLEPGTLVTRARDKEKAVLRTLPYRGVMAITYVRGRRPKGQDIAGAQQIPENYVGGGVFGGGRHWVTIQTATDFLILRLEDRNVITAMAALEARTGVKVTRETND